MVGVIPDSFTMKELVIMADAKRKEDWEHTSALMALIANINSAKGSKQYKPSDFNPYHKEEDVILNDLNVLKNFGFREVK